MRACLLLPLLLLSLVLDVRGQSTAAEGPMLSGATIAKLRELALAQKEVKPWAARVVRMYGMGDRDIDAKEIHRRGPDGGHIASVLLNSGGDDIFLWRWDGDLSVLYLTDSTGKLRAATIADKSEKSGLRALTNAEAQEGFNAVSRGWAAYLMSLK